MGCEKLQKLLPLLAGGEVDADERLAVEAHSGVCVECRRELTDYQKSRTLLAGLREGRAPLGTFEAVWQGIEREIRPRAVRSAGSFEWLIRAAAVLAIGCGIGYIVNQRGTAGSIPQSPETPALGSRALPSETPHGLVREPAAAVGTGSDHTGGAFLQPGMNDGESFRVQIAPMPRLRAPKSLKLPGHHYLPHVEEVLRADGVRF